MGKSADFSEGIRIIREAHGDSVAILEKWREIIQSPGEVVLTVRKADGTAEEYRVPSIREAINRYLGGVFEQITLQKDGHTAIIRLDDNGNVVLANGTDTGLVSLSARNVMADEIRPATGATLPIIGNVQISGGTIGAATITVLQANNGRITRAEFSGAVTLGGSSRIDGDLSVKRVITNTLTMGNAQFRKQVVRFGVEGLRTEALNGPTDGDIWTGDASVLEGAGIFSSPTWADCTYTPDTLLGAEAQIRIYWGESGDTVVRNTMGGDTFNSTFIAAWPYKMYEQVDGGYRIRWLPLDDMDGRIHYGRVGASSSGLVPIRIDEISSMSGTEVQVITSRALESYSCQRFMAMPETISGTGSAATRNWLFKV